MHTEIPGHFDQNAGKLHLALYHFYINLFFYQKNTQIIKMIIFDNNFAPYRKMVTELI